MMFKRAVQRYGQTPEPETPYQRAGQLWDERIGSARVQARNWRLMAFGGLMLSAGLAAGVVWQSLQSRVTPYVVEVDRLGEARAVGPAIEPINRPIRRSPGIWPASSPTSARSRSIRCWCARTGSRPMTSRPTRRRSSSTTMPAPTIRSPRSARAPSRSR